MLKRLVLLTFLLALTGLVIGAEDGLPSAPAAGFTEDGSAEILSEGGSDIPGDPAHSMSEAVNIYIHVILRQPEGPNPPELWIVDTECEVGSESVYLMTNVTPRMLGANWFNVWRRPTWPMYFITDLDDATMLLDDRFTIDENVFLDVFMDSHWETYGSKGVCDPDVNYFYVVTSVDSNETTEEISQSPYPSNCVAEFDQLLTFGEAGNLNIVSYPCDHDFIDALHLMNSGAIPSAFELRKHNPVSQNWMQVIITVGGSLMVRPGAGHLNSIDVGEVFAVMIDGSLPEVLFSTYAPGYIAEDGAVADVFYFPDGWEGVAANWRMVPMRYSYDLRNIHGTLQFRHLGMDIGHEVCESIRIWDASSQSLNNVASYIPGPGWMGTTLVVPGRPMAIMVRTATSEEWPPHSS